MSYSYLERFGRLKGLTFLFTGQRIRDARQGTCHFSEERAAELVALSAFVLLPSPEQAFAESLRGFDELFLLLFLVQIAAAFLVVMHKDRL